VGKIELFSYILHFSLDKDALILYIVTTMEEINLLILKDIDCGTIKDIQKSHLVLYQITEKSVTNIGRLQTENPNIIFIDAEDIKYSWIDTLQICKITLVDYIYKENIESLSSYYIIIVNFYNKKEYSLQIKNLLTTIAFITQSYVIAISDDFLTYIINPFGLCELSRKNYDSINYVLNLDLVEKAKKLWNKNLKKMI
jgi:hypothetical protein